MKISQLIEALSSAMEQNGDIEIVYPEDTGMYPMVGSITVEPMFLHDGWDPAYSEARLPRQNKDEHEHVLVIRAAE